MCHCMEYRRHALQRMRQLDVGWCALKTRVVQVKTLCCPLRLHNWAIMTSKSVNFFKYVAQFLLSFVPLHACQTISVIRVRRRHEQNGFRTCTRFVGIKNFPWWSLLLFVLSMVLWSLSIALKVTRTVTVLCQLAVHVIAAFRNE